jgi:hypothetical protein
MYMNKTEIERNILTHGCGFAEEGDRRADTFEAAEDFVWDYEAPYRNTAKYTMIPMPNGEEDGMVSGNES